MSKPLLISFSGGRSSAFMTRYIMENNKYAETEKVICFANTGKEREETLEFVNECARQWGLHVVWLEAVVRAEKGKGTDFKIVDFESCSRNGEPFKAVIEKYGIPSVKFPHCTRELKQVPIRKYMQSLGYNEWVTAIGIRSDERHRMTVFSNSYAKEIIYPLAEINVTEPFVRAWWSRQAFDLRLKDYEGNCDLCWKKSKRKRLTILSENPNVATWWHEMEVACGKDKYWFDQREGIPVSALLKLSERPFTKAIDARELREKQYQLFDYEPAMDWEQGCYCKA